MGLKNLLFDLQSIKSAYLEGMSPSTLLGEVHRRIKLADENPIWIYLLNESELAPYLDNLKKADISRLPLYGVPFAIKDNIDLQGVTTTAACPDFSYEADRSAFVVEQLVDAGAIPIGKTNLDQFATGLVGTRSPYGAVRNSFSPKLISGGSSSGSAVAVALGQVSFALGTDTAGSGRVPAALNNLVGYKPTFGIISCGSVVPACRTLDCVSFLTNHVADAQSLAAQAIKFDPMDSYSRRYIPRTKASLTIGLPKPEDCDFSGNNDYKNLFDDLVAKLKAEYATVNVDIAPQLVSAELLYNGPWVAERFHAARKLLENRPDALREEFKISVASAPKYSAVDYFNAEYRLADYRRVTKELFETIDALVLPTVSNHFSIADVDAEPIRSNNQNGKYTNFVNLLDLAAIAIPGGFTANGLPFGISLIGSAMSDALLMQLAQKILANQTSREFGASGLKLHEPELRPMQQEAIPLAVCGAHLTGMPLNHQLTDRHAEFREVTVTSQNYRLYKLAGGPPLRPGLVRTTDGVSIEVEVWDVPKTEIGSFLAEIPAPLGLGKVELESGEWVSGFICEAIGVEQAIDVSIFGGWRTFLNSIE